MIQIHRGDEPDKLKQMRPGKLSALRQIMKSRSLKPDDFKGYRAVAGDLWEAQRKKCCFCEMIIPRGYNDVEHYRPKVGAEHGEPHAKHDGYWWLAFTWENLLFSCPGCNEGGAKGNRFPLTAKSIPLRAEQPAPGGERALLIDPATECGITHIQFRPFSLAGVERWKPFPRDRSVKGAKTIWACALDRDDYVKLYTDHVNRNVRPHKENVEAALGPPVDIDMLAERVHEANLRLLRRSSPFVGLSYDALRHFIPDADLAPHGLAWRRPV